jgi:hypothetical protein
MKKFFILSISTIMMGTVVMATTYEYATEEEIVAAVKNRKLYSVEKQVAPELREDAQQFLTATGLSLEDPTQQSDPREPLKKDLIMNQQQHAPQWWHQSALSDPW